MTVLRVKYQTGFQNSPSLLTEVEYLPTYQTSSPLHPPFPQSLLN